jgi:putative flippase GtrA
VVPTRQTPGAAAPTDTIFRLPRPGRASAGDWAQLVRFLAVGGSGYVVNLVVFSLLVHGLGVHYLAAGIGAFVVAWCNNFVLNKYWTFRRHGLSWIAQGARYLAVSLVALGLNLVLLHFLVLGGLAEVPAQAIAIAAVTPVNFLLNRRWSFL